MGRRLDFSLYINWNILIYFQKKISIVLFLYIYNKTMNNVGKMNNKRIQIVGSGNNMRSSSGRALSLEELTMEYKMTLIMYNKVQSDYINYLKTAYDSSRYRILCIGHAGRLWNYGGINTVTVGGKETVVDGRALTGICTGNDGKRIFVCGEGGHVYTKPSWDYPSYTQIPQVSANPGQVTKIAQGADGTLIGIGLDHQLYTRPAGKPLYTPGSKLYDGDWQVARNPAQGEWCSAICIAPDGSVYVIGSYSGGNGFSIWKKPSYKTLSTSLWQYVADQYFIDFTILPDGMMIGVGTDEQLYTYPNYKDITSDHWGKSGGRTTRGGCCVQSVTGVLNIEYTQFEGKKFWGGDSLFDGSVTTSNAKLGNTYSKIPDKDSLGADYSVNGAAIAYGNATVEDCEKTCNSHDDCYGFVTYGNTCFPKTGDIVPTGTGALPGGALYVRETSSVTTSNAKLGNTYSKLTDKDSPGDDYTLNGAWIGYNNSSVKDCEKTCNSHDDCYGFAFVKRRQDGSTVYENTCYPKTSAMSPTGIGGARPGIDLYVRQKPSNIEACEALCSSTLNCSGATFNSINSTCKLSSGEGSITRGQKGDIAFMLEGSNLLKKAQELNGKLTDLNLQITNMTTNSGSSFNNTAVHNKGDQLRAQLDILRKERNKLDRIVEEKMELDEAEQEGDLVTNSNYYSFVLLFTLIIIFIICLIVLFMPNFSLMQPPSLAEIVSGDSVNKNVLYIAFVVVLIAILTFLAKRYETN
jgi:hypothetical protein